MVRMREESSVESIRMALTEKSDMLGAMIAVFADDAGETSESTSSVAMVVEVPTNIDSWS